MIWVILCRGWGMRAIGLLGRRAARLSDRIGTVFTLELLGGSE
jgi:hypothetical protein